MRSAAGPEELARRWRQQRPVWVQNGVNCHAVGFEWGVTPSRRF